MTDAQDDTLQLLRRWHAGDRGALEPLLVRDLDMVRTMVRRRLGDRLREHGDTNDFVQEVVVEVLEYGPRFLCANRKQFCALLARIVANTLAHRARRAAAPRRGGDRVRVRPPTDSVLSMDPAIEQAPGPGSAAAAAEEREWVRLALELIDPEARALIEERQLDQLSFADIGTARGLSADAARMRHGRATAQLGRLVVRLQAGELPAVLADLDDPRP